MENSTFTPGQSVTHKRYGVGTVVSTTDTKVVVDFNGTEKQLIAKFSGLKAGDKVTTHADKYKARKAKQTAKAEAAKPKTAYDFIQANKVVLLMVNKPSCRQAWDTACDKVGTKAVELNNEFVQSVLDNAIEYGRMSEKQAYCVAKWAYDNGITL